MSSVEAVLASTLTTSNAVVSEVAEYLLATSGKRLRPALVLLSGQFGRRGTEIDRRLDTVAAAVELIHMATLVHDDILDNATLRRGQEAVRVRFSDGVAVLAGDYLFARAFQLFATARDPRIVDLAADVVHVMCVGEIAQQLDTRKVVSEAAYRQRIEAKTAYFLEASCRLGAMAAEAAPDVIDALGRFGHNIGMAFQVVDDLLDWQADPKELGKAIGGDLSAGVYTLPVIFALSRESVRDELETLLSGPDPASHLSAIRALLDRAGALDYAHAFAETNIQRALGQVRLLPDSPGKNALTDLAQFILARNF